MKTMMRPMLVLVVILTTGSAMRCQTHSVYIDDDQGKSKTVANALRAKIGGTTRYVLVDYASSAESDIKIMCLEENGYFCSYSISYLSPKTSPAQLEGTSGIAKGASDFIAEALFEVFVSESSDEKIAAAVNRQINLISMFCKVPEHKEPCGQAK